MSLQPSLFEELDAPATPDRLGQATIGIRPHSKVLASPKGMASDFDYSLNPYVGCGFGCAYCFAANFVADEQRKADWGKWVDIMVDAEEQLARAELRGKKIFMSSATDPYQPLEQRVRLTRRVLEVLVTKQPYLVVQTRSPLVSRDIDLFLKLDQVRVNMSITTDSEEVRKKFEPSCASIERRFEALEEVSYAGIPVCVCISPMLPIENPERFAKRILEIRPARVYSGFFHHNERQFAASTRPGAWDVAKQYKWTRDDYTRVLKELSHYLPMLKPWEEADAEPPRMVRRSA
ncbi:MAG TPA: radical SAM protein [Fimbriimonadaceae bacterium]|nr:radical SAM protein [Fimbriimonadaceae bacterium]